MYFVFTDKLLFCIYPADHWLVRCVNLNCNGQATMSTDYDRFCCTTVTEVNIGPICHKPNSHEQSETKFVFFRQTKQEEMITVQHLSVMHSREIKHHWSFSRSGVHEGWRCPLRLLVNGDAWNGLSCQQDHSLYQTSVNLNRFQDSIHFTVLNLVIEN